ncbi:uncharacterized protein PF3D7_1120000-like isoform X1 [Onthophagus taurus]|uniref:uncharacterized protein PF3D7_1120000-like isoform X1 n=2 Tax=Onthophagus taurus TaxID=166361 RepID=UPI0039BDA91B
MGNEQSTKNTTTKEEMDRYQQEYHAMKNLLMQKDQYINEMMMDRRKINENLEDLQRKYSEALQGKQSVCENLGAIKAERGDLYKKIENLRKQLEDKDDEMKKKVAEAKKNKKTVTSELNKYKSMAEFEAIMKLNSDLVDFQAKIESVVSSNCDLLQMSDEDREIESIKRKNAELYGQLQNSNVRTLIKEKSAELKEAENELNMKREVARQEFLKVNGKLMIIKEKMAQSTKKFAGTIENAMGELQKNLQTFQKEVNGLEEANIKINESLSYVKIKNILLQQQNALMNEMIGSNIPGTSSTNPNKPIHKLNNDFSAKPNNTKPNNVNNPPTPSSHQQQNDPFDDYCKVSNISYQNLNETKDDSDDDNYSIFDDDASETSSISGKPKTYKIILLNVHEMGNKSDDVKVEKVLRELTALSLDDVDVRRVGKPTGKPRPIVVAFDSFDYVREILKNRYSLKKTKFNMIRVCPYKSKPDSNKGYREFKPRGKNFGNGGEKRFPKQNNNTCDGGKNSKKGPF